MTIAGNPSTGLGTPPRHLPNPLPAIRPLPEYAAEGELAARYGDMKAVLQVPWMGVVTMAFAHYPNFFGELWRGLRPLCASQPFVAAVRELRAYCEDEVENLGPPAINARLAEAGYGAREVDNIRAMIEIFSHGNFPYLMIATLTRSLLLGGSFGQAGDTAAAFEGRHAPDVSQPFLLMERHHADGPTQAVYDDIMATLGLPFVNTDYRALARWPSFFALAWGDLKPSAQTAAHKALANRVYDRALALANGLPNPGGLNAEALQAAAQQDAPLGEILPVTELFHYLLPQLVVNVAFFRAQLQASG
ncbi:MAG: hypothetical protein HOM52_02665 [Rhodospirillaceae bacterium]|nr:hypothetical protein [Rhodospirillaceae bacterium]MBT5779209.1 hypothetical protein [Rhodospirillaceae bacterium]